ncbi:MAG TPA: ABC transporter ATP-binding protein [Acidobacteriota bacterium]|nr:ABC transporter ATP-binding protein [Acidobacteriota bacterium]
MAANLDTHSDLDTVPVVSRESRPLLGTHHLSKSFGKVRAVDDLSISVPPGKIYGFLGRNGAGKTTTLRMLMGIIRPDQGQIELDAQRFQRIGNAQKRSIGYVSQEQYFYPWMTCAAIGKFVSGFYPTWDEAEYGRLTGLLELPPERKISALSGGMKVKLALALALAHRPRLLVLDEPTSGLDPYARREFLDMIAGQARKYGRTTLFSSHIIEEVERVADLVGIIHDGRLLYEGDLPTLKRSVRRLVQPPPQSEQPWDDTSADTMGAGLDAPDAAPQEEELHRPILDDLEVLRDTTLPNGSREMVLFGNPHTWEQWRIPPSRTEDMSLEDIFIALTGKRPEL